jgi:hypothetical protein
MRFRAGDSAVDVVVDIDRFELPITSFLPGIAADTIESARSLLEPDHLDCARGQLSFAIQSFVVRAAGLMRLAKPVPWIKQPSDFHVA